ncbi:MAG TPA: hypothetical protein VGD81_05135, partial [Opitutaceae bacterium]
GNRKGVGEKAQRMDLPPCPHLPTPRPAMDWRSLHLFRDREARGAAFYGAALEYGHFLWRQGYAARAILCLDRAFGADLRGDEPVLASWPPPYAAMAWFLAHTPTDVFLGNPRVHFQHYADRLQAPRREPRRWRAWACWALTRVVRPEFPNDPRHDVREPAFEEIAQQLELHGWPGEVACWRGALAQWAPDRAR